MSGVDQFAERISSYLTPAEVSQVRRAFYFAEQAHDGQRRRSGEPYVTHPLAVANILATLRMDHQSLMAGMLHDVIEDTGIGKDVLAAQFGDSVAELVDGVSKLTQMPFESKAEAQAENFQKMALAMARDIRVILVKLADRLHNMRTLEVLSPEKRRRIAKETLEIYAPIAHRLGIHAMYVEFEDLGFKAMYPLRARRIGTAVGSARQARKATLQALQASVEKALEQAGITAQIESRDRHLYSIYQKMRNKRRAFNEIMDVSGFRILVDKVDTCYRALGVMHGLFKPLPGRFRDYIAIPKANGYQSLHTTLFGSQGLPMEVQIRTRDMDEMARNGIAAHWLYRSSGGGDEGPQGNQARAERWLKGLLELQQRAGDSLEFIESVKIDLFPHEVYLFTPKGRIMELPKGATAVDFAYAVHTDIGNTCIACRINRRLAPLSTPLVSGQTVEIITAPGARPNPAWLNFVVTGKARTHIRHVLKQQRRSESIQLGERLLHKALDELGGSLSGVSDLRIQQVLKEARLLAFDDLLEQIGLGHRMALVVARQLFSDDALAANTPMAPLAINGTEGIVLHYAKCCKPIPGDAIVGHLAAGKGMVVHAESCRNIVEARQHPDKYWPLNWSKEVVGEFAVELRIEMEHQRSLIAALAASVNSADGNLEKISLSERDGRLTVVDVVLTVRDRTHLAQVIKKLRALKGVTHITRIHG